MGSGWTVKMRRERWRKGRAVEEGWGEGGRECGCVCEYGCVCECGCGCDRVGLVLCVWAGLGAVMVVSWMGKASVERWILCVNTCGIAPLGATTRL